MVPKQIKKKLSGDQIVIKILSAQSVKYFLSREIIFMKHIQYTHKDTIAIDSLSGSIMDALNFLVSSLLFMI